MPTIGVRTRIGTWVVFGAHFRFPRHEAPDGTTTNSNADDKFFVATAATGHGAAIVILSGHNAGRVAILILKAIVLLLIRVLDGSPSARPWRHFLASVRCIHIASHCDVSSERANRCRSQITKRVNVITVVVLSIKVHIARNILTDFVWRGPTIEWKLFKTTEFWALCKSRQRYQTKTRCRNR